MLFGISLFSLFLTGCGETKTKEEVKEEVKTEVKKEMEVEKAKEEAEVAKEEADKAKEEAEKAKEEAEIAKEEANKAKAEAEEAANKSKAATSTKKAKAATKSFTARVSVSKMPKNDRKARFQKAAEAQLKKMAAKAGYGSMVGGIQWVDAAPKCPKDKCMRKAKATFKK